MIRRLANPAAALLILLWALGPVAGGILAQSSSTAKSGSASSASSGTAKKKKKSHHHSSRREPFQKAPSADRISEIQSALARGGYYQGAPNGKWDSNTVSALQKFQSENSLNASGKLDATSLQKLGLGSSTAGLNPPTAPQRNTSPAGGSTGSANPASTTAHVTPVNSASNTTPAQPRR